MKIYNWEESFVKGYEFYKIAGNLKFDEFLSAFHAVDDPGVRHAEENPCEAGIIVDNITDTKLSQYFRIFDRRRITNKAEDVLSMWAADIQGAKAPVRMSSVRSLYERLMSEV